MTETQARGPRVQRLKHGWRRQKVTAMAQMCKVRANMCAGEVTGSGQGREDPMKLGIVAHVYIPSTYETEAEGWP